MVSASSDALGDVRVVGAVGKPGKHVVVSNYGWYLFNRFPIVCGNASSSASCPFVFFRDDVTINLLHGKLTSYAAENQSDVAELNMFFNDNMIYAIGIPNTAFQIPIPYILCYRERTVSGLLMNPASPLPAPAPTSPISSASAPQTAPDDEPRKQEISRLLDKIPDGGVK